MKFLKKIDKSELMGKVTRAASKYGYKLKKASPTIMIVGAAVGGVTATVLACKATIKAQDILKEHNAAVQTIHDTKAKIDSGKLVLGEGETYTENATNAGKANNVQGYVIASQSSDPGAGSALESSKVLLVYE